MVLWQAVIRLNSSERKMPVASATILADTMFFIRDFLRTNITDPITRLANEQFIMTSYPQLPTSYPLITIKDLNITSESLGLQSEDQWITLTIEIRVWGRNVVERAEIAQDIVDELRSRMVTLSSSQAMHNYRFGSMVNVDEPGDQGIKSKILNIEFDAVLGE